MPKFLICPPTYFGIEYEINPWMSRLRGCDLKLAEAQWSHLRDVLVRCGAELESVEPHPGLPDLVFTANAGLVVGRRVVLSRFRFPARSGEEPVFKVWFAAHGFEVTELPPDVFFEGAGDALYGGDPPAGSAFSEQLFCGYHFRSEIRSHDLIAQWLGRRILSLQLTDPRFYHLDTCFCPLEPGQAMYYPGAFDEYARQVLRANLDDLIEVCEHDALRFGCNAVRVGNQIILPTGCTQLVGDLCSRGYTVHPVNLSEYLKSGGAAKCLTLRLA